MSENSSEKKLLYNADEAGKRLGVTGRQVLRYLHEGEFPNAFRLTTNPMSPFRIPIEDIESFEKRRMVSYRPENGR